MVNCGLSGGSIQSSPLSAATLYADFITPNSCRLPIQPNSNRDEIELLTDEMLNMPKLDENNRGVVQRH